MKRVFKIIAGEGELGDTNWGFMILRHPKKINWEIERLIQYKGKQVFLAGGGGTGLRSCILNDAKMINYKDMGKALQVFLSKVEPPIAYHNEGTFDPYIGSWQILIEA